MPVVVVIGVLHVQVNFLLRAGQASLPLLPQKLFSEAEGICYKGGLLPGSLLLMPPLLCAESLNFSKWSTALPAGAAVPHRLPYAAF